MLLAEQQKASLDSASWAALFVAYLVASLENLSGSLAHLMILVALKMLNLAAPQKTAEKRALLHQAARLVMMKASRDSENHFARLMKLLVVLIVWSMVSLVMQSGWFACLMVLAELQKVSRDSASWTALLAAYLMASLVKWSDWFV